MAKTAFISEVDCEEKSLDGFFSSNQIQFCKHLYNILPSRALGEIILVIEMVNTKIVFSARNHSHFKSMLFQLSTWSSRLFHISQIYPVWNDQSVLVMKRSNYNFPSQFETRSNVPSLSSSSGLQRQKVMSPQLCCKDVCIYILNKKNTRWLALALKVRQNSLKNWMSPSTSCQSYRRQERRGTCWGYQVQSRPGEKFELIYAN